MFSRDLLCKVGNLLWLSHLWAWGGLLCHSKNIILHHLPKRARKAARGNQICKVCFREPTFAIVKTFYDCPLWVQVATEQQQVSFRIYPVCTTTHTKRASKIAAGGGHICELYPNSCKLENLLWLSPLSPSSSWATTGGFVASFFFCNGWLLTTASSGELEEDYCVRFKCRKEQSIFFDKQQAPKRQSVDQSAKSCSLCTGSIQNFSTV